VIREKPFPHHVSRITGLQNARICEAVFAENEHADLAIFEDMDTIQEMAVTLVERHTHYTSFAQRLINLAQNFEDEQIVALLKTYLEAPA
jgi:hypothetical protein